MLLNPQKVIPVVATILQPSDFSDPQNGKVFGCLTQLHAAGVTVSDPSIYTRELVALGCDSGKVRQLWKESLGIPNIAHFGYHADLVKNLSRLTGIVNVASNLIEEARSRNAEADDVLGWLDGQVMKLRTGMTGGARSFSEIADELIADLEKRVGSPEPQVLLSGLPGADRCGFVFGSGELAILAARPGIGKTSLATQIATHHAGKGRAVLMASLEMRDREVIGRVLYPQAGHNHQAMRQERVFREQIEDLRAARQRIGDPPLFVWSPGRVRAGMIHAAASVLKASQELRLLIVDYIGLVRPDDPSRQRYEQVGEIAKALRDIGQHLEIPVLCLCQLNREADKQRPTLANLRESGDIEQDADVVAFLHRPEPRDKTRVELIVEKDRQGAAGATTLTWHPEQTRFEDTSAGQNWSPTKSYSEAVEASEENLF